MMILIIMIGLCAAPLFVLGLFMKKGKGLMLLAGYNTMPKEERDKIDKTELARNAGNLMLRLALEFAVLGVTIYLGFTWAAVVLLFVTIADPCVFAIRMSRILPKTATSKSGIIITIAIIAITFIAVGIMFYYGEKEPMVSILDNHIQIEAMYGLDIDFSEVTAVSLIEKSMKDIGTGGRTNGYGGFGETLKGHFRSDRLGSFLLFVKSESSPTMLIERDGKENIYISFRDEEKTKVLYRELAAAIPSR